MAHEYIAALNIQSFADLCKEINLAKREGYANIDIGGSEPTLYPRLPDLIKFIHSKRLNAMLCTNGARFSEMDYVKSFRRLQPLGFEVSVHSHRADTFDLTTGVKGSFNDVLSGIRNLKKYLRLYPDNKEQNFVAANIVITSYNYTQLPMITSFLHEEGIKIVKYCQLFISGRVYKHPELLVRTNLITPYLEKALTYAKAHRMHYSIDRLPVCLAPSSAANFVPYEKHPFSIKLSICEGCRFVSSCCGITKTQLMAEYKDELLGYLDRFQESFFTKEDKKLLRAMSK